MITNASKKYKLKEKKKERRRRRRRKERNSTEIGGWGDVRIVEKPEWTLIEQQPTITILCIDAYWTCN